MRCSEYAILFCRPGYFSFKVSRVFDNLSWQRLPHIPNRCVCANYRLSLFIHDFDGHFPGHAGDFRLRQCATASEEPND